MTLICYTYIGILVTSWLVFGNRSGIGTGTRVPKLKPYRNFCDLHHPDEWCDINSINYHPYYTDGSTMSKVGWSMQTNPFDKELFTWNMKICTRTLMPRWRQLPNRLASIPVQLSDRNLRKTLSHLFLKENQVATVNTSQQRMIIILSQWLAEQWMY